MTKTPDMPIWVFLPFSSIETRNIALLLISSCVIFTVYCVPWSLLFVDHAWVAEVFLIDDWTWFAMMVPMVLWYCLSLSWLDRHSRWASVVPGK